MMTLLLPIEATNITGGKLYALLVLVNVQASVCSQRLSLSE